LLIIFSLSPKTARNEKKNVSEATSSRGALFARLDLRQFKRDRRKSNRQRRYQLHSFLSSSLSLSLALFLSRSLSLTDGWTVKKKKRKKSLGAIFIQSQFHKNSK
jgi:hypothetical protein